MVGDYVKNLYAPAAASSRALSAGGLSAVRELAAWKQRVRSAWTSVHIEHVEADGRELSLGAQLEVHVTAALGGLTASDVAVEVVFGRAGDDDEIADPTYALLSRVDGDFGGSARFSGMVELGRPGPFGYTVRIVPNHPLLSSRAELGLVTYPDAPAGMTNGDLR
jgi:starch phosphorylase